MKTTHFHYQPGDPAGENDNLYIVILKFGYTRFVEGFPIEELKEYVKSKGHFFNDGDERNKRVYRAIQKILESSFDLSNSYNDDDQYYYYLATDAYFQLLEYEALEDAREQAKEARRFALWAIGITIITSVASMILSIIAIKSPVSIDQLQFQRVEELILKLEQ